MAEHDKHADHPEEEEEQVVYEEGPWSKYLWGGNAAKLLNGHFGALSATFGFYYVTQFILALSSANFYSDSDRFISCGITGYDKTESA